MNIQIEKVDRFDDESRSMLKNTTFGAPLLQHYKHNFFVLKAKLNNELVGLIGVRNLVSNLIFRIADLAVSLLEMKKYGSNYAKQIIKNSQTLASELYKNGIPVLYKELNYTQSHMFKLKTFSDYQEFSSKLERANIIIDNSGRIGTNEMTRMGMKEKEMKIIAEYISIIYNDANSYKIKDMVIELKSKFQLIKYC